MDFITDEDIRKIDLSNFAVLEVKKSEDFVLVTAIKECRVYFAFYKHFIVCSGDYGEWVFDCTWETAKNPIPNSMEYLLSKLSRNHNKYEFSSEEAVKEFKEWLNDFIEYSELKGEVEVSDFQEWIDEVGQTDSYRIATVMDGFSEYLADNYDMELDGEDMGRLYKIGEVIHHYLMVNLAMLNWLRENKILDDKKN